MDKTVQRGLVAGAALAGVALIGGAFYVLQERRTEEPDYRTLRTDGDFQIRDYPALTVAEGFRIIADYIFAKSRPGEKIEMTVPVTQDAGDPMASDPPLFDDDLEGAWRTRFVMPAGRTSEDLPEPPAEIDLVDLPPRKVAVVSFAGRADDRMRGWLARNEDKSDAEPEYAFYNSPMIPGPLRRNEVWLPLG